MTTGRTITIEVPGTPSSWKRKVVAFKEGKRTEYNDPAYRAAKSNVGWLMLQALGGRQSLFFRSTLSIDIELRYPDRRVRDADRALNLVLDAGKGILFKDDTWTTFEGGTITVRPKLDAARPGMTITVIANQERPS